MQDATSLQEPIVRLTTRSSALHGGEVFEPEISSQCCV